MISNYIFHRLAMDSVDSSASAVLPSINRWMRLSLNTDQLPEYTYLSLKTLLGEAANNGETNGIPDWAIKRIVNGKRQSKFKEIDLPSEFPLILVKASNYRIHPERNNKGDYQATVEITVQTDPEKTPSSLSFNLIQRIHQNFVRDLDQPIDIAEGVSAIKGICNLKLRRQGLPFSEWDVTKAVYIADAKIIE